MFTVINKNFDAGIEEAFEIVSYEYRKSSGVMIYTDSQGHRNELKIGTYNVVYVMNSSGSTIAKLTAK